MKNEIQALETKLQALTKDMYYSYVGDEPYITTAWNTTKFGTFSIENFLAANHALKQYGESSFLSTIRGIQPEIVCNAYQELFGLLVQHLSDLTIYGYTFPLLDEKLFKTQELIEGIAATLIGVPIIMGKTLSGEWIGLTLKQKNKIKTAFPIAGIDEVGDETQNLLGQIEELKADLKHQVKISSWEITEEWIVALTGTREDCMEKLLADAQMLTTATVSNFLQIEDLMSSWKEGDPLPKEKLLLDFFTDDLTDAQVYTFDFIIGSEWLGIHCLFGNTPSGDKVGAITDSFTF